MRENRPSSSMRGEVEPPELTTTVCSNRENRLRLLYSKLLRSPEREKCGHAAPGIAGTEKLWDSELLSG
jgi:hypothetical protein